MKRKTDLSKPQPEQSAAGLRSREDGAGERGDASEGHSDDLMVSRAIVRLIEVGSFSATARTLGVSVSAVTRALQRAEERLGVALFLRSTHGISPTHAGRRYADHLQRWLVEEESMRSSLHAEKRAERGALRVTMPVWVAEHMMPPVIVDFQRAFPRVMLDVHASDDIRDVIKEGFDLAIRNGPLVSSNLRMRVLSSFGVVVVAAPGFFEGRAVPRSPEQLRDLPCLFLGSGPSDEKWSFWARDGELSQVSVSGSLRANNVELLCKLAEAGLGVGRLPDAAAAPAIAAGKLVRLLPEYDCNPGDARPTLYAVHAKDPGKDRLRDALIALLKEHAPRPESP